MKKIVIKDKQKRRFFYKQEKQYFILNLISKNLKIKKIVRLNVIEKKHDNFFLNTFKTQFVNKCTLTANKKRTNKITNFSRIEFLKIIRKGFISGFKKASW